jgi:hypothetical protein
MKGPHRSARLLDHLVGKGQQRFRDGKAERLGDPLISAHSVPESDHNLMDEIVKRFGSIAAKRPIKHIRLVHHVRKPAQGGHVESGLADARRASAVPNGVRAVSVVNRMTEAEALRAKVEDH